MKRIVVLHSDRSEDIITPVVKRLRRNPMFVVEESHPSADINSSADLVIAPFDRPEVVMAAVRAFYMGIPIAQVHAGDFSTGGSFDDVGRHLITLMSTIQFCVGHRAYRRVCQLLSLVGKSTKHVYKINSISLDDLKVDVSLCPSPAFEYDLVVYNSPTGHLEVIESELHVIIRMLGKNVVWILPSGGSVGDAEISRYVKLLLKSRPDATVYSSVSRPMFLGLMKYCNRFIGNSSSMFYDAPYFLKKGKIVHVGVRNTGREYVKLKPGGSDQIVQILEEYFKGEGKSMKWRKK